MAAQCPPRFIGEGFFFIIMIIIIVIINIIIINTAVITVVIMRHCGSRSRENIAMFGTAMVRACPSGRFAEADESAVLHSECGT